MLKEIHEQPYAISETLRGRVEGNDRIILPELEILKERFTTFNKVYLSLAELHIMLAFQEPILWNA